MQRKHHIAVVYHRGDMDGFFSGQIVKLGLETLIGLRPSLFDNLFTGETKIHMVPLEYTDPLPAVPEEVLADYPFLPEGITDPVEDNLLKWQAFEHIFVVDISRKDLFESPCADRIIWIDHHDTAIEDYAEIADDRFALSYVVDKVAACRLCFQLMRFMCIGCESFAPEPRLSFDELLRSLNIAGVALTAEQGVVASDPYCTRLVEEPLPIRLAGEYDVFDHRDPSAIPFQHGLRSVNRDRVEAFLRQLIIGDRLFDSPHSGVLPAMSEASFSTFKYLLERGDTIQSYVDGLAAVYAPSASTLNWHGVSFCVLNLLVGNSLSFEKCFDPAKHDACFMWRSIGPDKVVVSMYSDKRRPDHPHLGNIAKNYGGGGHAGAAGFTTTLPWICGLLSKTE